MTTRENTVCLRFLCNICESGFPQSLFLKLNKPPMSRAEKTKQVISSLPKTSERTGHSTFKFPSRCKDFCSVDRRILSTADWKYFVASMQRLLVVACLLGLATIVTPQECGTVKFSSGLIYGGNYTKKDQYPWLCSLHDTESDEFFCGATLVSARHILTGEMGFGGFSWLICCLPAVDAINQEVLVNLANSILFWIFNEILE